jgi:hypothetical protein
MRKVEPLSGFMVVHEERKTMVNTLKMKVNRGRPCFYVSTSGKRYHALVVKMSEGSPWHQYTPLPTLKVIFKDKRGKQVVKEAVLPYHGPKGPHAGVYVLTDDMDAGRPIPEHEFQGIW